MSPPKINTLAQGSDESCECVDAAGDGEMHAVYGNGSGWIQVAPKVRKVRMFILQGVAARGGNKLINLE